MKNQKKIIALSIILMTVGFAAVSTTLFVNGNANIGTKEEDFDVYFSDAHLENKQVLEVISQDKKAIHYETRELHLEGEYAVLDYEVTNASHQYDAEVSVICTSEEDEWINLEVIAPDPIVKSRNKGTGEVIVTLKKTALEEKRIPFVCTLGVHAIEKTEVDDRNLTDTIEHEIIDKEEFDYSGKEEIYVAREDGIYQLEVWGAQGGSGVGTIGGYGGYSVGKIKLSKGQKLFINVGGMGESVSATAGNLVQAGGYNGGGNGNNGTCTHAEGGGGGATHIAFYSGILSALEERKEEVLIVAGGGGGGHDHVRGAGYSSAGGSGGGFESVGEIPATQKTGYAFGQGNNSPGCSPGGGGGFYGGKTRQVNSVPAAGGSGYIGNSLLSGKSMACYGCVTSDEETTKTISVTKVSAIANENCAKSGNGYAKITYLGKE